MPKTKISEFSATPANNTDIDSINLAEGMAPSLVNDAIRELMAQLKDFQTGAQGDSFNGPIGSTTPAAGAFTTLSASSTATLSGLTASTALALDASKNIVSVTNTGTGNNVLATSPTLVTPILGTPTSATLTNATGLPIATGVSGLGTGVATFLATPSSANLAAALTDETGSGANVFATSPTLVTPILGVATGTSFQGIIGNVTPAAGSFTTLGASSTATLNTLVSSGATLTGGTINGMTVGATTATTGAFTTLTATGDITAGFGSGSTSGALNGVTGSLQRATSSATTLLTLNNTHATNNNVSLTFTNPDGNFIIGKDRSTGGAGIGGVYEAYIYTETNRAIVLGVNNAEKMRLNSTGLGIGTSSVGAPLEVYKSTNGQNRIFVNNPSTGTGAYTSLDLTAGTANGQILQMGSGYTTAFPYVQGATVVRGGSSGVVINASGVQPIYFGINDTEQMRLTSTGLGIGLSSPSEKLDVNGNVFLRGNTAIFSAIGGAVPSSLLTFGSAALQNAARINSNTQSSTAGTLSLSTAQTGTGTMTERMVIDASGLVGIGTPSPTAKLDVLGSGDGEIRVRAGSDPAITFSETSANKNWKLKPSAGDFNFQYSATAYNSGYSVLMTLASTGTLKTFSTVSVGNATPSSSGAGITFPATQSASSDANTLDDYEEGTWTPNVGGTATYGIQQGSYIKVGRLVTVSFDMYILLLGTGSTTGMSGLPFTVGSATSPKFEQCNGAMGYVQSLAVNVYSLTFNASANGTTINSISMNTLGGTANVNPAIYGNGTRVQGTVTYIATT